MDSAMWEMIGLMNSVAVVSISVLVGYWMTLRHRRKLAERSTVDALEVKAEIDELRGEMHEQVTALHERLDFAERLLAQSNKPKLPPVEHSTPV